MKIKIDECERYPFITVRKIKTSERIGDMTCVFDIDEEKLKEWEKVMKAFERMQDELEGMQQMFYSDLHDKALKGELK